MSGDVKLPSCHSWFDKLDPSCRKCAVRESCTQRQSETRPECFAELYEADHPECLKCLDKSQCAEESIKMATPKIRIKRPAVVVTEPEPEEEPIVAEAEDAEVTEAVVEAEDEFSPYDDLGIEELRAEATSRKLDSTGKRSALIARLEEDDAKPVVKPAAPAPKPVAVPVKPVAKAASAPVAPKPVAVAPKVAPTPIPQKSEQKADADVLAEATLADLFELMGNGSTLVLTKENGALVLSLCEASGGKQPVATKAAAPVASAGPKLRGDAFWKEVLSEEYYSWYYEDAGSGKPWGEMTQEEKVALADELGVDAASYAHDDQRMANMRMVEQVQKTLGLEKYKAQYKTAAAREALKS